MVTGGLGGLGLRLVAWLVSKGLTHVILLSRSTGQLPEVCGDWQSQGVAIERQVCDVGDEAAVARVFDEGQAAGWHLVGIYHLSSVLTKWQRRDLPELK